MHRGGDMHHWEGQIAETEHIVAGFGILVDINFLVGDARFIECFDSRVAPHAGRFCIDRDRRN